MNMQRYKRQIDLPNFGEEGQEALLKARVLVVGAGGLGSPVCIYLAAAGVGTIGVIDGDLVERKNLHRQVIHPEAHQGIRKARSAKNMMRALNSEIKVNAYPVFFTEDNAYEIAREYDLIIDCCDNFSTRYLTNKTCLELNIPMVFGAVYEYEGQVSVFDGSKENSPCYECLFPNNDERKEQISKAILGTVPAVIGSMQANEAIKIITGFGESLSGSMLHIDLLNHSYEKIQIKKRKDCICNTSK